MAREHERDKYDIQVLILKETEANYVSYVYFI